MADPPADSPSTINISHFSGSFSWQSASLPGNDEISKAPFLRVRSRAFLAASLAAAASTTFPTIIFASFGCYSNQLDKRSLIRLSTTGLTSEDTNLSFVWLENFGSATLIDKIQVKPSLISSPTN